MLETPLGVCGGVDARHQPPPENPDGFVFSCPLFLANLCVAECCTSSTCAFAGHDLRGKGFTRASPRLSPARQGDLIMSISASMSVRRGRPAAARDSPSFPSSDRESRAVLS